MRAHTAASALTPEQKQPALTIGDIFRRFGPEYRQGHHLADGLAKVMRDIEACRTPALGGHRRFCQDCGHHVDEYNSCGNRHCPGCQALRQARWIAKRQQRVLPVTHFHVVFTLPAQLRSLALANRRTLFALLMRSAADTLLTLGNDPKRLGAQLGITAVLHTWTRELAFHPHVHCVVTAGGLANDGSVRWVHTPADFLFPVHVMGSLFRGKFLAALEELYQGHKLRLPGIAQPHGDSGWQAFARLKDELYNVNWVVYCKRPFAGPQHVFSYLGRYTHRIAISNQRLIDADEQGVRFRTKDGNTITLPPHEFIRRFLMHVLPRGFTKIRHYGLMASGNVHDRLEQARALLTSTQHHADGGEVTPAVMAADLPWQELLLLLTGIDVRRCPACGSSNTVRRRLQPEPQEPLDTS